MCVYVCLWLWQKKRECNIASIYYPLGILNKPKTPCACDGVKNERTTKRWRERERHTGKIENDENLWERKLFLIWKLFVHSRERQCAISGNGISHRNQWTSVLFFHRLHSRSFVRALSFWLSLPYHPVVKEDDLEIGTQLNFAIFRIGKYHIHILIVSKYYCEP